MKKLILLLPLLFLSCEIDHGLGVMKSRIAGKVIFINKELKPNNIDALRAVAVTKWDPVNFSLSDVIIANTSINQSREVPEYYIPAPFGSYQLVAIVFRKKGEGWNYLNLLGFYGCEQDTCVNKTVILTESHPVADDIDIICDWKDLE